MSSPFPRLRRSAEGLAAAAALTLGLLGAGLFFSSPASADSPMCNAAVSAPTGPATVSTASSAFGRVLVEGAGPYAGCSLYVLTSDQLHALIGSPFACSDGVNVIGPPCDSVLWPALLTDGAPIAGPGVNRSLLGTVTRADLPDLPPVQQVTYAGLPLYRFIFDEDPGETEGANLFDPVTDPPGTWYLVDPSRGLPAPGQALLQLESAPVDGTGPDEEVLAATMDATFHLLPDGTFPVYSLSTDSGHTSACQGLCTAEWQPLLTSGRPDAAPGVDQHALGTIVRPDGTHQVTYDGKPLYLDYSDAYIPGFSPNNGMPTINGDGVPTPWGVFNAVQPFSS